MAHTNTKHRNAGSLQQRSAAAPPSGGEKGWLGEVKCRQLDRRVFSAKMQREGEWMSLIQPDPSND